MPSWSARSAGPIWPWIRGVGARRLYAALRGLDDLDDAVESWPGHIGGSLCGGANLSQKPSSTLGYERRANPYLAIRDEDAFADRLVRLAPSEAAAVERVVRLNLTRALPELREPPVLATVELGQLLSRAVSSWTSARPMPSMPVTSRAPSTCRSGPARSVPAPGG